MKAYICYYVHGSYEDRTIINVFVTTNIEVAQKWVNKFNKVIEKYKDLYKQFEEVSPFFGRQLSEKYCEYVERWDFVNNVKYIGIEEIEIR